MLYMMRAIKHLIPVTMLYAVSKSPTPGESASNNGKNETGGGDVVPENASVTASSECSGAQSMPNDDAAEIYEDEDDEGISDIRKQRAEHEFRKQEGEWLTKREKVK